MIEFWLVVALMTLVAIGICLVPLLKEQRRDEDVSVALLNTLVYRDRLAELEAERERVNMPESTFVELKRELELSLLSDAEGKQTTQMRRARWLLPVMAVTVPVMAGVIYWQTGRAPALADWMLEQRATQPLVDQVLAGDVDLLQQPDFPFAGFMRALQRRLQSEPDNADAWYLLGLGYLQVNQLGLSQDAFERTRQLRPTDPRPVLAAGMAHFRGGDLSSAIATWETYLRQPVTDPRATEMVKRAISAARAEQVRLQAPPASNADAETGAAPSLAVTVTIAGEVQAQLAPEQTLFVFAKAEQGPPMPLAVARQPVGTWPVVVTLDDSMAMMPAMKLSRFERVVVQARISQSGNALPESGDWVSEPAALTLSDGAQSLSLEINQQIP